MNKDKNDVEKSPIRPISHWKEKELLNGDIVISTTVILRGKGCVFAQKDPCHMCGYNIGSICEGSEYSILKQLYSIKETLKNAPYIKIYTSGSFIDHNEINNDEMIKSIEYIHSLSKNCRLLFESRPEFITHNVFDKISDVHDDIEVAIGLESLNPEVRDDLIGKRFSNDMFFNAADLLLERKINLKIYLLMKPPFLNELDSIQDILYSVEKLSHRYDRCTISINPMNVQRGTLVEKIFNADNYRPPWLWSLTKVLIEANNITNEGVRIVSHPTGGGRKRGVHNCGKCDDIFLAGIEKFNISKDTGSLKNDPSCCYERWIEELSIS